MTWKRAGAEEAYQLWSMLYLRPEAISAAGCLRWVEHVGATRGWRPPKAAAFLRRLRSETPAAEIARSRGGRIRERRRRRENGDD